MTTIEDYLASLRAGEFKVPVCTSCRATVWPPSSRCSKCYSLTALKKTELTGTLIEFSNSHVKTREGTFGVIDIKGIRLIGSLKVVRPYAGMKVRMAACGVRSDGSPYYEFEPAGTRH